MTGHPAPAPKPQEKPMSSEMKPWGLPISDADMNRLYEGSKHDAMPVGSEVRQLIGEVRYHRQQAEARARAVPNGWKLVPVEATDEMAWAALEVENTPSATWCAMLAAVPEAPGSEGANISTPEAPGSEGAGEETALSKMVRIVVDEMAEAREIDTDDWQRTLRDVLAPLSAPSTKSLGSRDRKAVEWQSADLREIHYDLLRLRDHHLGGKRWADLLRGAADVLMAADAELRPTCLALNEQERG